MAEPDPSDVPDAGVVIAEGYKIVEFRQSVYIGNVNDDNLPHGFGYMTFHNCDQHQGEFREGRAHGPAVFVTHKGEEYEGTWDMNKRVGTFIVTKASGNKFTEVYNEEGKLKSRKKIEGDVGEVPVECWTCGGKFRETFNNDYACRRHRGEFRWKPGTDRGDEDPGVWSCCVKDYKLTPGCDFSAHNLKH
eukprot:TRINITY_DN2497_c0_g1_i3.p1 TRINITY_DN2497_c0_g1~~TRINITY_DN2497_c0_g1_i3.p1  ORF type:complete len:190 (+),score=30.69 TRINITY_DN2497_c0_g1_i3:123-692(+)